ncbi:hypothetical protein [Streptosporangium amethystogenes]|uniref:hypothetical protein n=1 Tax=Streptosporangium amethystogenes TaxID=2002 RepID=UPI0004C5179A|nr:hypothetical protein [Streptosporangium amethystogenes]
MPTLVVGSDSIAAIWQWAARTERRTIRTAPADESLFPGARQAFRLRRDIGDLDGVWTSKEIVYGITSLPAGPGRARSSQPLRTRSRFFRALCATAR